MIVDLDIENVYEDGYEEDTHVVGATVPDPTPDDLADDLNDWAHDHLFPFTGVGRSGDAYYGVRIKNSDTMPELRGKVFEFGL